MSDDEKPKTRKSSVSHSHEIIAEAGANRSYYVPHLKEYRSIKDLTQQDRESIADNLFGPSELKERNELIQQMKKLAGEKEELK